MADLVDFGIRFRSEGAPTVLLDLDKIRAKTDAAAKSTDRLTGRRGFGGIGAALQKNSFAVTNAANQFSDLAVQIGAGVPATRALSQQLPQLTAFMGPVAAILGVVGGVAIGAAGAFFEVSKSAGEAEDPVDNLTTALDRLAQAQELARASNDELVDRFGETSSAVRDLIRAQVELEERNSRAAFDEISEVLKGAQGDLGDAIAAFDRFGQTAGVRSSQATAAVSQFPPEVQLAAKAISDLGDGSERTFGEMADAAAAARRGLEALDDPTYDALISQLIRIEEGLRKVTAEADIAFGALRDMSDEYQAAATRAGIESGAIPGVAAADLPQTPGEKALERVYEGRRRERDRAARGGSSGSSGGGGGMTEAERELKELERFAEQVFKNTRTNAEKMAEGVQMLDAALAAGLITQDTYERALEDLTEKLGDSAEALKGLSDDISGEFSNALRSMIDGTADAGDAILDFVDNVLLTIADKLIQEKIADPLGDALGAFVGSIFGSAKGNAFDGGSVVPFARGGIVNGPTLFPMRGRQTGLMGEAGPEAIVPLRRGTNGNLGIEAQKPVVNVTVNNNSGEDVDVATDSSGNIEVTIGRLVAKDIASGGPTFQAIKKTFGQQQRTARRG